MNIFSFWLAFLLWGSPLANDTQPYVLGDAITDFALPGVQDKDVQLSEYAGEKGVILIFSCNECPYVHKYEQRMIDLHNAYAPKGWPVLAVSANDPERMKVNSFENMKLRAEELNFPFAYVQDPEQEQYRRFGATKTPEVFLLQKSG
ncbi:MAG: redoxin domain-containing protein, partial [Bacteroidota bacterium]